MRLRSLFGNVIDFFQRYPRKIRINYVQSIRKSDVQFDSCKIHHDGTLEFKNKNVTLQHKTLSMYRI